MPAELPPDVRDRAARAAFETMRKFRVGASWLVTVELTNAVGAVLAAEQSVALREMARRSVHNRAAANELFARSGRRARKLTAERDALKARVAELEDRELQLQEQAGDMAERLERAEECYVEARAVATRRHQERDALKARVAELEEDLDAAQVEVRYAENAVDGAGVAVLVKEHRVRGEEVMRLKARVDLLTAALTRLSESVADRDGIFDAQRIARAVLSATPSTPVPHTCQLPDIATVREPSSFNDRRWDCPVCDARWIAMGRIVGRRSRYEWRQMPVTKTVTPTKEAP